MGSDSRRSGGGGYGGGDNVQGGGGGGLSIPAADKKIVQNLKEIVGKNCTEAEIYVVLLECNMDADEAVHRLLSQGCFVVCFLERLLCCLFAACYLYLWCLIIRILIIFVLFLCYL